MTPLVITTGAGKDRPQGARLDLRTDVDIPTALYHALTSLDAGDSSWWSPHRFVGDYRKGENWRSSVAVVVDADNTSHADWTPENRVTAAKAIVSGAIPGSIVHLTPHGMRVVFALAEPVTDPREWVRAAKGAGALVLAAVAKLGLPMEVDVATEDKARFFWAPNAVVDGLKRDDEVAPMNLRPWPVEELAADAPPGSAIAGPVAEHAAPPGKTGPGRRHGRIVSVAGALLSRQVGRGTIEAAIRAMNASEFDPPMDEPRLQKEIAGVLDRPYDGPMANAPPGEMTAALVPFSSIEARPIEWLWLDRIPFGMLTLVEGLPGCGKSTLLLDLAARCSVGASMPESSETCEPKAAVILSAEDDAARVIRPRLELAEADLGKIHIFELRKGEEPVEFCVTPEHVALLEGKVAEVGAAIVVVDPIVAYLPGATDSHVDHNIRRALGPLRALAERTGAAVVAVRHWRKSVGDAVTRGGGSIGFTGAARTVLAVATDPDDDSQRVLAVSKSNVAPIAPSLAFRLVGDPGRGVARIEWSGVSSRSADDLSMAQPAETSARMAEAERFLRESLAGGTKPANEIAAAAEKAGHSQRTIRRAGARLGLLKTKDGLAGGWWWRLPDAAGDDRADEQPDRGALR